MKKKFLKKSLVVFLVFMMTFSGLTQFLSMRKVHAQNYLYQACYPDAASGTVKFELKYDDGGTNPSYAYVVGDFNNWTYDAKYKLTWQQDSDGVWKMINSAAILPGDHNYKYRVHYGNTDPDKDNDGWVPDGNNLTFNMPNPSVTAGMAINASRNQVVPGGTVNLVTNSQNTDGSVQDLSAIYSIDPAIDGATVDNSKGILTVKSSVADGTQINIKAFASDGKTVAKTIRVVASDPLAGQNTVSYFRNDKNYAGWNVWAWQTNNNGSAYNLGEDTDFGKIAGIGSNPNFILRQSVSGNDWAQKTADLSIPQGAKEVYVVDGDNTVYTDFKKAIDSTYPQITSAIMDSANQIVAYSNTIPQDGTSFDVYANGIKIDGTTQTINDKKVIINIPSIPNFDPNMLIEVRPTKLLSAAKVTMRRVLDSYFYSGNDLGATYTADKINLKLWAPTAAAVNVMTYTDNSVSPDSGTPTAMSRDAATGVWSVSLDRSSFYGKYYMYQLEFYPTTSYSQTTYAVDPYATAVGLNGNKGALISMDDIGTIPSVWNPNNKPELKNPEDSIIYEMHIRDFTIDANSGVDADKRGKFLGAAETGTVYHDTNGTTDSSVKTGIDHLKELGVTHVHLLPVFDFGSVDESNTTDPNNRNWGYDPKNYNAVEGSYSTNPGDPKVRIKEFRQMIEAMHDAGIRVIMDVVYNHMLTTTNMDNIVPGYYFRSDDQGHYTNGSGCNNEVASDRPMIHKFIVDSTKQWVNDYSIDGFRFDLMALIDTDTIKDVTNSIKAINPTEIVYGEPWDAGGSSLDPSKATVKGTQKGNHFAVFNDNFRDALRGNNTPGKGYVNDGANSDTTGKVMVGLKGSIDDFTASPEETINYAEVHDNYCLWDQLTMTLGKIPDQYRNGLDTSNVLNDNIVKRDLLTQGILYTAQGIPLTQEGSEFLRTKKGDGNSYKSSDDINQLDWKNEKDFKQVFDYNKGLIQLRKEHPAFRMTNANDIRNNMDVYTAYYNPNIIITHLKNNANGDKWANIVVIYNPTSDTYNFNDGKTSLADPLGGQWHCVVNDTQAGTTPIGDVFSGRPTVKPYSMMVLYDQEN